MTTFTQKLFKRKSMPILFRLLTLVSFILILFVSYFGALKFINPNNKIALFVVWTLWWPILYITLLFFARAWCGFLCPLSLANELGNKVRKGKTINIMKWSFVAYIIFFLIVLIEQITGLFLSLNMTLLFFASFLSTAFIMGIFFSRWSFCKYVCPIGTVLSVFSRLSFIGLRTDEEKCKACRTKDCLKGRVTEPCPVFISVPIIKSNRDCLLCTKCIKNCPYDSADIKLVKPGKEIIDEVQFRKSESLFIIALLGFTFILNTRGTQFFRSLVPINLSGAWLRTLDFIVGIGLPLVIFGTLFYLSDRKEGVKRSGYIYLPLTFSILFFSIIFGFLGPYVNVGDTIVAISKYIVLLGGSIWSIYFAYRLMNKKLIKTLIHSSTILLVAIFWIVYLIPGPLNAFPDIPLVVVAEPGETIRMNSFSMGFIPDIIIAKKGQEIVLDIDNKDIVHAFDIDEFDVHRVLLSGAKSTIIKFTPDKVGEFTYYCNIPGHTEAGMKGKLIVEE